MCEKPNGCEWEAFYQFDIRVLSYYDEPYESSREASLVLKSQIMYRRTINSL